MAAHDTNAHSSGDRTARIPLDGAATAGLHVASAAENTGKESAMPASPHRTHPCHVLMHEDQGMMGQFDLRG